MERLHLGDNQLNGEIPPWLGDLASLRLLDLSGNRLSGEIPAEFGNLANLTWLVLSGNQLSGCVPSSLQNQLNSDYTYLGGLPFCRGRETLVALYHATDGPNWKDNTNWLSNAPLDEWQGVSADSTGRVVGLNLTENRLTGQIPEELGDLANLESLGLEGWFPARMPMPLRAKSCAFRPMQTIDRLYGRAS